MKTKRLGYDFFNRTSLVVAQDLLNCIITSDLPEGKVTGKIIETESYSGEDDLACHASRGRTKKTETLYRRAGTLYVYLNYGLFYLLNIVCDKKDFPSAVLIRSLEIIEGEEIVKKRIINNPHLKLNQHLATGPGKLCAALGITKDYNNLDIITSKKIYLSEGGTKIKQSDIIKSKRIGVDYAGESKDNLWRFYIENEHISKKK